MRRSSIIDCSLFSFFSFSDTSTTEIYTLSLHDALPILVGTLYSSPSPESDAYVKAGSKVEADTVVCIVEAMKLFNEIEAEVDRKSTRLNSSHVAISYAVFCLKKKKIKKTMKTSIYAQRR